MLPLSRLVFGAIISLSIPVCVASAQLRTGASIAGRIFDVADGHPLSGVTVTLEGTAFITHSDSGGHYRLSGLPSGPQVLLARRVAYAAARVPLTLPVDGALDRDIGMAAMALRMQQVQVTADAVGRARGELGTASVINREAIANQSASSLAGVLELVPGTPLQAPGLDNVQQFAIRSVPTTTGTAERLGAFGTLIVLDGVPLSNNANLQTTGPRGEIIPSTAAGGGIDLRRIPAAALERVEVIRGVPSARYGDLTAGAIVIDTRAGVVSPELMARYDPRTAEGNFLGKAVPLPNASLSADIARTLLAPGFSDAVSWRGTVDAAHRATFGAGDNADANVVVLDTRLNVYQVYQNEPEQPDVSPGVFSSDRSGGARFSERARLGALRSAHLEITASVNREWQDTRDQLLLVRGAEPFTDRLTPGRSTGYFVGGAYPAAVHLEGAPWQLYDRVEASLPTHFATADNMLRAGAEWRREWNAGPGYQFAIAFPPQVQFNGVNGYDRPRRYDAIPPVATSAPYVDDRFVRALPLGMALDLQAGLRAEVLHSDTWWTSGARDVVVEPRVNAQLAPKPWLRLRTGWGRTAKLPALGDLYPAPQYYDVVNVNWYPPNPAERLAVLTTSIANPTNPQLGFAIGHKAEAGAELDLGETGAALTIDAFRDVTTGSVGYAQVPSFLLREHFALTDSTIGTGHPPGYVTPAQAIDTVPIFVDRPTNAQRLENRGLEITISLPEISAIHSRLEVQGAWITSRFSNNAVDFGLDPRVTAFQLDSSKKRLPYWLGDIERGERALTTARVVHHQPALGLVITGTVQYFIRERTVQEGAIDTLAWAGYVTRAGQLVPVPPAQRGDPQYADLRTQRADLLTTPASPRPDWLLSLQVAKAVLGEGRLSFYAFNALDRLGQPGTLTRTARLFPRARFGLDLTVPLSSGPRNR